MTIKDMPRDNRTIKVEEAVVKDWRTGKIDKKKTKELNVLCNLIIRVYATKGVKKIGDAYSSLTMIGFTPRDAEIVYAGLGVILRKHKGGEKNGIRWNK